MYKLALSAALSLVLLGSLAVQATLPSAEVLARDGSLVADIAAGLTYTKPDATLISRQVGALTGFPSSCNNVCADNVLAKNTPACKTNPSGTACSCASTFASDWNKCISCVYKADPSSSLFSSGGTQLTGDQLISGLATYCQSQGIATTNADAKTSDGHVLLLPAQGWVCGLGGVAVVGWLAV